MPGKNWTGDQKLLLVDGRDRNIARPFIRAGVYDNNGFKNWFDFKDLKFLAFYVK